MPLGVVTALLLHMLERGRIDGALVSRRDSAFSRQPLVATTREEIISAAGSQFAGASHLEQLGGQYTTYTPSISAVKGLAGQRLRKVAMVGTPCQINTVRKMQCLSIVPSDAIVFTVGLFCMENFSFGERSRGKLEKRLGISFERVVKLNIKEEFLITLDDGGVFSVPLGELEELARPACLACTEFANDYADVSLGGLGSPEGYTTTLVRSDLGRRMYGEALAAGCLEERQYSSSEEMRRDKAEMLAKVTSWARFKEQRGQARRRELRGGRSVPEARASGRALT